MSRVDPANPPVNRKVENPPHTPSVTSLRIPAGLTDYERGVLDGLSMYAWWKDGTEYVGTCGTTLEEAAATFLAERGKPASVSLATDRDHEDPERFDGGPL